MPYPRHTRVGNNQRLHRVFQCLSEGPEIPCHTPASVFPSLVGRYDHRVHTVLGMEETVAAQPIVIKIENRVVKNLALLILSDGRTPLLVESIFIERVKKRAMESVPLSFAGYFHTGYNKTCLGEAYG